MFLLVAGRAQSRGRADEPIRTQRDSSRPQDSSVGTRRSKRRSEKESGSSNKYPPIIVGPLTTNQDLINANGEKVYNLPLMIQQPFLREKKEPIKVDISVKLIPKPKKKDKKKREAQIEEIIIQADEEKGVRNSISMEVVDGNIQVLKETVEVINSDRACEESLAQEAKEVHIEMQKPELEVPKSEENIQLNIPDTDAQVSEIGDPNSNVPDNVYPIGEDNTETAMSVEIIDSIPEQESNQEVAEMEPENNNMEIEEQNEQNEPVPDIELNENESIQDENATLDNS